MNPIFKQSVIICTSAMLLAACSSRGALAPQQLEYLPPTLQSQSPNPAISPVAAAQASPTSVAAAPVAGTNNFSGETVGAQPTSFVPAVGNWVIGVDGSNKVLVVDGRKWQEGQASAGIAEQARSLYGARYAEFLDNVKAYAYFPFAIDKNVQDFRQGEITVRFKPIDGRIDQGAGIVFNLKPNGNYLIIRANALENNLVLFKYEKGQRSSVEWVRNTPTATRQWHELKVSVTGDQVKGYLDGKLYLQHTLPAPVSGKVGVWSKADSVVYFDDFRVTPSG